VVGAVGRERKGRAKKDDEEEEDDATRMASDSDRNRDGAEAAMSAVGWAKRMVASIPPATRVLVGVVVVFCVLGVVVPDSTKQFSLNIGL
jgi:hypothetical protein